MRQKSKYFNCITGYTSSDYQKVISEVKKTGLLMKSFCNILHTNNITEVTASQPI